MAVFELSPAIGLKCATLYIIADPCLSLSNKRSFNGRVWPNHFRSGLYTPVRRSGWPGVFWCFYPALLVRYYSLPAWCAGDKNAGRIS